MIVLVEMIIIYLNRYNYNIKLQYCCGNVKLNLRLNLKNFMFILKIDFSIIENLRIIK